MKKASVRKGGIGIGREWNLTCNWVVERHIIFIFHKRGEIVEREKWVWFKMK